MQDLEIGAFEAKNRLSQLISQAEKGQHIYITRRGKRVALLAPADYCATEKKDKQLLEAFRQLRHTAKSGKESLKELIEQGRRSR